MNITREVGRSVDASRFLFYHESIVDHDDWNPSEFHKRVQNPGDLGARMEAGFEEVLNTCASALIIGSDCPGITKKIIDHAFDSLNHNDLVVGPTEDGGYYLLGMKQVYSFLFSQMEWSTEKVFRDTLTRITAHNLSLAILPVLSDLDNLQDLKASGIAYQLS